MGFKRAAAEVSAEPGDTAPAPAPENRDDPASGGSIYFVRSSVFVLYVAIAVWF